MDVHAAKKKTSAQGSTGILGPAVANVELPTDVEVSSHPHGAATTPAVLAAREAQHGARLHEAVAVAVAQKNDAGLAQGPQGDHREVPVEVDCLLEVKAVIQEERDASGEFL